MKNQQPRVALKSCVVELSKQEEILPSNLLQIDWDLSIMLIDPDNGKKISFMR